MLKDYFKYAIGNLMKKRLRSWLTMLGIFVGIATIVALVGLGEGLKQVVMSQFSFINADVITVSAGSDVRTAAYGQVSKSLGKKELKAIENIRGIKAVAPRDMQPISYSFNDYTSNGMLVSIPYGKYRDAVYEMVNIIVEKGKKLEDKDDNSILIGYNIANKKVYDKPIAVGDTIKIKGKPFKVQGIIEKKGSFMLDNAIAMNEDPMYELIGKTKGEYPFIGARVEEGYDLKKAVSDIERSLRKIRNVDEQNQDFTVEAALDTLKMMESTIFGVQLFIYIIAGISIVVGGIGIMNTMFTSVLERTKEIGIMKAIGARNRTIFVLFLIESGLLGTIGGLIGIILGVSLGKGAEAIGRNVLGTGLISAHFAPELIIGALLFSFIIGSISGIWPAMRAAKMHPVTALAKAK